MDQALAPGTDAPAIEVRQLSLASGSRILQRGLDFEVGRGQMLAVLGEAGVGKSALFRSMLGLLPPAEGDVLYSGQALWSATPRKRSRLVSRFGVLLTGGALLSTKTLLENVALPLQVHTRLEPETVRAVAHFELGLMGLTGYEHHYPGEVDEYRRVSAGLARAVVLDPDILFLEDPTAGLDPQGARRILDSIRQVREQTGATVVLVSNDLAVVLAADDAIFLGLESKTMRARGNPAHLRDNSPDDDIRAFLKGGQA